MQAKTDAALTKKSSVSKSSAVKTKTVVDDVDYMEVDDALPTNNDKRLSVERIYQKKTQLEHILLRPDTYIGSVETVTQVCAETAL